MVWHDVTMNRSSSDRFGVADEYWRMVERSRTRKIVFLGSMMFKMLLLYFCLFEVKRKFIRYWYLYGT